jgi:hypothetical protein
MNDLRSDVTQGKKAIAEELNKYNNNIPTTPVPTWDDLVDGVEPVYELGYNDGYPDGYAQGNTDGYNTGYIDGYEKGSSDGYETGDTDGYLKGYDDGYEKGYEDGYNKGYEDGYNTGYEKGYADGYADGYDEGRHFDDDAKTAFVEHSNSKGATFALIGNEIPSWEDILSCVDEVADYQYNKGLADGKTIHNDTYTLAQTQTSTVDLTADHTYRYVNASAVYQKGYNDGYAARTPSSASITYTYHHHCISGSNIHASDSTSTGGNTYADNYQASSAGGCFRTAVPHYHTHVSSCYSTCGGACSKDNIPAHGGYINGVWYDGDGSGETDYVRVCTRCGHVSGRGNGSGEKTCSQKVVTCGKTTSTVESYTYSRSCGLTTNAITQAVIVYN